MNRIDKSDIFILVCILGIFTVAFFAHSSSPPIGGKDAPKAEPPPIISIVELQQQLVDLGYDIKVDGKICEGWNCPEHSKTLQAWYKAINNQHAAKYFEGKK